MFSTLTEVLQQTLTSMGNHLHGYPKSQIKLIKKLTERVTKVTSSQNPNVSWLQGLYLTHKILIIQILTIMKMRRMMDRIVSLLTKLIVVFIMKMA